MNRRTLLQSVISAGLITQGTAAAAAVDGYRERIVEFALDGDVHIQMIVRAYPSPSSAERWCASWEHRAFVSEGEWYLQHTEDRELPKDLATMPGLLQFHEYIWGEAAEEDSILKGVFRRNHVGCVIRISGDHEEEMIALAEYIARQHLPEPWELLWNDAQLQAFVPTTESLGIEVTDSDEFWP